MRKPINMVASSPVEPKAVHSNKNDFKADSFSKDNCVFPGSFFHVCPSIGQRNTGTTGTFYTSLNCSWNFTDAMTSLLELTDHGYICDQKFEMQRNLEQQDENGDS